MNSERSQNLAAEKMRSAGVAPPVIAAFTNALGRLWRGETGLLPESALKPAADLPALETLPASATAASSHLGSLAVIKLNGGLGTSMGLEQAKSLMRVKGEETFLDLIAHQVESLRAQPGGGRLAFYLMNSFSTRQESLDYLRLRHPGLLASGPIDFLQSKVPKLDAATLEPVRWPQQPDLEWCPPGHGDLYPSLLGSGLLEDLLARGVKYAFVSNSDNLGATVDGRLLDYFAGSGLSFLMEVAQRTAADRKGGHLARRRADDRLVLRESAQCPPADLDAFQDIQRHACFNTNNLWLQLEHLKAELDRNGGMLPLPLIANHKTVDPKDPASPKVIQIETAMGAAIENFPRAGAMLVPRSRFAPVKTTADLLAVRSDAYELTADWRLQLAAHRNGSPPVVDLDSRHFRFVGDFERFFHRGVPSLARCTSITVTGAVEFNAGVICRGRVRFSNPLGQPWAVPAGIYQDGEFQPEASRQG